ncbi:hypothetical protein AYO41_00220 [Verrucomicrobia bacterium SCGC AG-212-E04]|nr:hypothetical protein AYO41_00220 [Verrucomicrobia bacterium SCGC AG-212-E04]
MNWYILQESGVAGPIDGKEMDLRLARGELSRDSMVGNAVEGPWGLASSVFPVAFGIISVTAVPPVFQTGEARRLMAAATPASGNVKSAPIPLGVSPSASSAGEMRPPGT